MRRATTGSLIGLLLLSTASPVAATHNTEADPNKGVICVPTPTDNHSVGTYISDSDGMNFYRGLVSQDEWYYSWNGNSRGGHYSMRQAIMENCVPVLGCWVSKYPFVKIWVTANGGWSYAVGE